MKLQNKSLSTQTVKLSTGTNKLQWVMSCLYRDRYLYLLLLPFIIWYALFQYRPMWGLQIAFKEYSLYKGIDGSPWVGLANFKTFLTSHFFVRTFKNTILISLYSLLFGFPVPIILALLTNEVKNLFFKKTVQTMTYLPYFISAVVVAGIVTNLLSPSSGMINAIIAKMGGEKIYFLTRPEYFRPIFVGMNVWKDSGFNAVIYIAALASIDGQLYEACVIDGGNKWKQLLHVTIPGIMPTVIIMLILRIGSLLEVGYEAILLLYQPATYETADVLSTYVFRTGLMEGRYALATAAGLFNSVIALCLVFIANKISNKVTQTGLW